MFLPRTDDCLWRANVATPTLCSRMHAATIRGRLLFFGGPPGAATIRGRLLFGVRVLFDGNKKITLKKFYIHLKALISAPLQF